MVSKARVGVAAGSIRRTEDVRTGLTADALARAVLDNLTFLRGQIPRRAQLHDWYYAMAYAVRDRLLQRWVRTVETVMKRDVRVVSYLSAEFLLGPHLGSHLIHLGILDQAREAATRLGVDLEAILAEEEEPGLGNGGLGRLAACFMDSLATLEIPAIGYGIRYEFGIFDQEIRDGWQAEVTDKWLRSGNPWEIVRPEIAPSVGFGGRTERFQDEQGRDRVRWIPHRVVKGVAHDTPVSGYRVNHANLLRLWKAEACESFDFQAFNVGDYWGAVHEKVFSENITKVLYPNDEPAAGKELRLEQQYFFVSCSLQDMLRMHLEVGSDPARFHESFAVQLNDTHPSIGVAELMRLLIDEQGLDWDRAWHVTRNTFGYTNHTLLPEALEKWPLPLFGETLPRHLEIIYEINRRFLDEVRARFPGDEARAGRMSIIDESGAKAVRMAHLATVGSHAVNGVATLHTELLKKITLRDFHDLEPEKFHSITNGVTPRRWVTLSNPRLSALITERIGDGWIRRTAEQLPRLEPAAEDASFRAEWRAVKEHSKRNLAMILKERTGVVVDPTSLFDIHVKRFHEYKRQHLNVLHILTLHERIRNEPTLDLTPRTFVFAGKAAPGYRMAKLIIKLIHGVAEVVNSDPAVRGRIMVAFLPDFNVKNAQPIYPAADLSEQISTAGLEASGTGNMKFAFNGAITIGTLDGANIEIRDAVGAENFALFGLTADEVAALDARGYDPRSYAAAHPMLGAVLGRLGSGDYSRGDRELFRPLLDALLGRDEFKVLADYAAYVECQDRVGGAFRDSDLWTRMSILNTARVGRFSSDRAIDEYNRRIWKVNPVKVRLD